MKQITAFKCEDCHGVFETLDSFEKHMDACCIQILKEADIKAFNEMFPEVKCENCDFANGGWSKVRGDLWLLDYKNEVQKLVKKYDKNNYEPFTYGWFRCLDDNNSTFYRLAMRVCCICSKCYREWGQPYYADNCKCNDRKDKK